MKILKTCNPVVTINGQQMSVPDCNYIRINQYGHMQGWQNKPSLDEGYYRSNCGEEPCSIAIVDLEEGDEGRWQLFSVSKNRFLTYDDWDC